MPSCICGAKVDRLQEVLQCKICSGLFHLECCGIGVEEAEFIKEYKCKSCISMRRNSLTPSSAPVVPQLAESRVVDGAGALSTVVVPITVENNAIVNFDHSADHINNNNSIVNKVNMNEEEKLSANNSTKASSDHSIVMSSNGLCPSCNSSFNDLSEILKVIAKLQKSNDSLVENVNTLQAQNKELLKQMSILHAEVKKKNISIPNNGGNIVSPKRKKVKSTNLTQNDLPETSFPASESCPITKTSSYAAVAQNGDIQLRINKDMGKTLTPSENNKKIAKFSNSGTNSASSLSLPEILATSNLNDFVQVSGKKKKKHIVVGVNDTKDLGVVERKKWLHLSSFACSVTAMDIISYIVKHADVIEKDIACFPLIKKDANLNIMKFVNFKVGVVESAYTKVFNANLWPTNVKIRPFDFLEKKDVPIPTK